MVIRIRLFYVKFLLKLYNTTENILPKFSIILKKHIENVALSNSKLIYKNISKF